MAKPYLISADCPKCGRNGSRKTIKWQPGKKGEPECLVRSCGDCGYWTTEPCADARGSEPTAATTTE